MLRLCGFRLCRVNCAFVSMTTMSDYELAHAYETINLYRRGAAAKLELNRPGSLNAWDKQLGLDLLAAISAVGADSAVRAVTITGAGRAFSSGADLKADTGRMA